MPELPEVETIRRDLVDAVEGATIDGVRLSHDDILLDGGPPAAFAGEISGRKITSIRRRGKNLVFHLEPGELVLQAQVRMTGRFAVAGAEDPGGRQLRAELGFGHVAAEFPLADGRTVVYDDVRRLGGFRLMTRRQWRKREIDLGSEPLDAEYRAVDLATDLGAGRAPVKNALLDQRRIAGVGNIYASEALFRARVDPRRPCGDLEERDHDALHGALRRVLREALEREGTSLKDYRQVDGRTGSYQDRLRVYGREGLPCPRCSEPVERIVQAGRSTFFCPSCQT